MSQSATLYRISHDTFIQLEKSDNEQSFDISSAKSYTTFDGSFMGMEYILSKGKNNSDTELIVEIFNPKKLLGIEDIERMDLEEQFELYESGNLMPYLNPSTISKIDILLNQISETDIDLNYDPKQLNDNGIYPGIWHQDNSPDKSFNKRQILEDLKELKTIIKQAVEDQDYILVFIG